MGRKKKVDFLTICRGLNVRLVEVIANELYQSGITSDDFYAGMHKHGITGDFISNNVYNALRDIDFGVIGHGVNIDELGKRIDELKKIIKE